MCGSGRGDILGKHKGRIICLGRGCGGEVNGRIKLCGLGTGGDEGEWRDRTICGLDRDSSRVKGRVE